jgi:hypothetical protein
MRIARHERVWCDAQFILPRCTKSAMISPFHREADMPANKPKVRPPVRVRHDPPTLAEAIFAAQGVTSDVAHQIEFVAGLMGVPDAEVKTHVLQASSRLTIATGRAGIERSVVVERTRPRVLRQAPAALALPALRKS